MVEGSSHLSMDRSNEAGLPSKIYRAISCRVQLLDNMLKLWRFPASSSAAKASRNHQGKFRINQTLSRTVFDDGEYPSLKRLKIVQCVFQAYAPLANASSEDTYPNDALHSALYRARNSLKYLDIQHLWRDRKAHQPLSKRIDMPALKEVIIPPNHRFNLIAIMIHRLCRLASPYS